MQVIILPWSQAYQERNEFSGDVTLVTYYAHQITPKISDFKWQWIFIISHNFCGSGILEWLSWLVLIRALSKLQRRCHVKTWLGSTSRCRLLAGNLSSLHTGPPWSCLRVLTGQQLVLSRASDLRRSKAETAIPFMTSFGKSHATTVTLFSLEVIKSVPHQRGEELGAIF